MENNTESTEDTTLDQEPLGITSRRMLEAAGWHDGYSFDTAKVQAAWIREGFPVHDCVVRFLSKFGGLSIMFPPNPGHFQYAEIFHLHAGQAAGAIYANEVEEFNTRLGSSLCPIGQAHDHHLTLLMDEYERVFVCGEDGQLCYADRSGIGLINTFCIGGSFRLVDVFDDMRLP